MTAEIVPILEVSTSTAEENAERFGSLLSLPRSALEIVPIGDGSHSFVVLRSPKNGAEKIERLVRENAELRAQLERASETIDSLLDRTRGDAIALEEARQQSRNWQRKYEEEIAPRKVAPTVVAATPPTSPALRIPRISGGAPVPPLELHVLDGSVAPGQLPGLPTRPQSSSSSSSAASGSMAMLGPRGLRSTSMSLGHRRSGSDELKPPTGPCRVSGCKCGSYTTNKEATWLCDCGHTSVKHLATPKGSPPAL